MTKDEFKAEMMKKSQNLRKEFPKLSAMEVYMTLIACGFDTDRARKELKNRNKSLGQMMKESCPEKR
jgi:hypothetical protein